MEAVDPQLKETNRSVKDMPGIKTGLGRARAFLRLALMQKKLPDYLDALQASDQAHSYLNIQNLKSLFFEIYKF